jgi:hypothetical protein
MSLDFVIAKSNSEVSSSKYVFAMNEALHDLIFLHAIPKKKYPTIYRIEDFYSDNMFDVASLSRLERELFQVKREGGISELDEFLKFIGNAIKREERVYLLAD